MSNWTLLLLCLLAFFVIRGLVRGKRRRERELLSENNQPQTTHLIAGLALADFTWRAQHAADVYTGGDMQSGGLGASGFDAGGFSGGGDMGGGGAGGG